LPSRIFQDDFWPVGAFQYQRHQPENTLLYQLVSEEDAMQGIIGASIAYRLAFGPNAGRKALTRRQYLPATPGSNRVSW
jgi:hypothetical protein